MIARVFEHFKFAFYDSYAKYFAQRTHNFNPQPTLNLLFQQKALCNKYKYNLHSLKYMLL